MQPRSVWDEPPPSDPAGESRSAKIDEWLREERLKDIAQRSRTLVLSPEGDSFDNFRSRVLNALGEALPLSDGRTTKVSTDKFGKHDKKRMAGMEPSVLVFAVDVGIDSSDGDLLVRMTKALAHYLFVARHLGLSENCVVVVLIARLARLAESAGGPAKPNWEKLLATLSYQGQKFKDAVATEFEAAANHGAHPLDVKVYFDDTSFENLTFLRGVIQEAHDAVLRSLEARVGEVQNDERFHDASGDGRASFEQTGDALVVPKTSREKILQAMSGLLFALELAMLLVAFFFAMPWDSMLTLVYFVLDVLHVPRLF
jgi:hypothetical protein